MEKQKLREKLDRVFSQYIRLRDMLPGNVFQCISCGRIKPINQADCGHYINRQHMATRFSEVNCNAQCRSCNRFDEGNMSGYRAGLVRKYGETQVVLLESMKNDVRKYSDFEYEALIKHYQYKIKMLLAQKNVEISCLTK
ncbi:MAG: recombination protein NinG [Bacteroidaceae bacterium]|nr:recombination protein NinG [Bacteroidaceae bacterium]